MAKPLEYMDTSTAGNLEKRYKMTNNTINEIQEYYYNLGQEQAMLGMSKTAKFSIKELAKTLGRGAGYTLPSVGTVGGMGTGGFIGAAAGMDLAKMLSKSLDAVAKADVDDPAAAQMAATLLSLAGGSALVGGGGVAGAGIGGYVGNRLGNMSKDKLLEVLKRKK